MNDERRNQHREFFLAKYDDKWVEIFEHTAKQLKNIFGPELIEIHHIGSTSIPGMLAKPQIDILMEVKDLDQIEKYYSEMERSGFKPMGRKYTRRPDSEYFVKDSLDGKRLISIHAYQVGNAEIENKLIFRDYLRENETARSSYIDKKRELYKKYRNDYPSYRAGKFDIIEKLKNEAYRWKTAR